MNPTSPSARMAPVAITLAVFALLAGCGRSQNAAEGTPEPHTPSASSVAAAASGAPQPQDGAELQLTADETKRAGVQVETIQPAPGRDAVSVTATIRANQDRYARIAPRVEGRLVSLLANLGDEVRVGQTLATLDSVAVGEAQSAFRQALSARHVADADFQRAKTLVAEEIIPQRDFLRAKAELEKADAELAAAQDKLRMLGATANTPASGTAGAAPDAGFALRSPIAGTVIEKHATAGGLASPSEPVFIVADLSTVWIEANLTEDMLSRVHRGAAAQVTLAAYPGERFSGKVTYIAGVMDKDTRAVPARIEIPNRDRRLKPEMFATVEIDTGAHQGAVISVPDAALILLQGQPTVFVQAHGGFAPRPVEPGDKLSGRTVVKSGLQPGDAVVVAGTYALKARLLKSQISAE